MDDLDRRIINELQDGFPVCEHPFEKSAENFGINKCDLIQRIGVLLDDGILSRFGPLYNIEKLGGAYSLAAMQVPAGDFESVADYVNSFPEVAHNYEREHAFNMWFVLAADSTKELNRVISDIEQHTGLRVYNMPKLKEYYVGLKFHV